MSVATKVQDGSFWKDRIGANETLLWSGRASHAGGPVLRFLSFLMFGYGAYISYKAIFIYASADEFCLANLQNGCEFFYYFAWPILILSLAICVLAVVSPLLLKRGWSTRRYAITDRQAYVIASGIIRANKSVPLARQVPVRMMGNALKISNRMAFAGLTDSEIETVIDVVTKAQRAKT